MCMYLLEIDFQGKDLESTKIDGQSEARQIE